MNKEDLDRKLKQIRLETETKINDLKYQFAIKNKKYNIGDIIEDGYHVIKIESIEGYHCMSDGTPTLIFKGLQLTKKLQPKVRKINSDSLIYEYNVIKKHEVTI